MKTHNYIHKIKQLLQNEAVGDYVFEKLVLLSKTLFGVQNEPIEIMKMKVY
jgi:hypothetical protein